jgi:hypothetical protein
MAIGRRKLDDRPGKLAWDFENGCMVLEDRVRTDSGDWEIQQRKVENDKFRAVIDLPNIERGWIAFVKGEGLNAVLARLGQDYGDPPSDQHKEGLRLVAKMDASLGGDVREFISTSAGVWSSIDSLHDAYLADLAKHPDCLPAVDIVDMRKEEVRDRTFHVPLFKIRGWVPRPPELPARASRSLGAPRKRTAMSRPRTGSRDRRPRTSSEARSHFSWGQ